MSVMPFGWCSRRECPCWTHTKRACPEWMGYDRGNGPYRRKDMESWPAKYCPCCGWEKKDHKSLIHKGRKP